MAACDASAIADFDETLAREAPTVKWKRPVSVSIEEEMGLDREIPTELGVTPPLLLFLPPDALPVPTASVQRSALAKAKPVQSDADEECALFGLSTTVANERLVEEVEEIVGKFLEHVKAVTWASRLAFLYTQEGSVAPIYIVVLVGVACYTKYWSLVGEALLVLPFHLLAWYISFRLPRAEQLRSIGKVQECMQRFIASEDAFTTTTRGGAAAAQDPGHCKAVPPSSLCVSVLRDRAWRQIPYNMVVEGDVFKLREGETLPCKAERLAVRPPYGAVPCGEIFNLGDSFHPPTASSSSSASGFLVGGGAPNTLGSFRALSTACVPLVYKFLQTAQRAKQGRTDTVFFELATMVRGRLKRVSLAAFVISAAACCSWLARPAVYEQGITWHLLRFLVPLRLVLCLVPLIPVILLQITDIWGNARIQSLFEWHAGNLAEERGEGERKSWRRRGAAKAWSHSVDDDDQSPGSGDIDASQVPLHWQLKELIDILGQGLDGPSNLMHSLNSTTVVCFCDREGLLTDTCATISEVCLCGTSRPRPDRSEGSDRQVGDEEGEEHVRGSRSMQSLGSSAVARAVSEKSVGSLLADQGASHAREGPRVQPRSSSGSGEGESQEFEAPQESKFQTIVLDVQSEPNAQSGLRFEDPQWATFLPVLKPLCLGMAVSRQPRELFKRSAEGSELFDLMAGDLMQAIQRGASAAMSDCVCNVSQLIGFRDEVLAGFPDVKFCMELCRPMKSQAAVPHEASSVSMAVQELKRLAEQASPNFVATNARPHVAWRATPASPVPGSDSTPATRTLRSENSEPFSLGLGEEHSDETPNAGSEFFMAHQAREPVDQGGSATNFSQTLMTWFVQDPRDESYQMFCKAKPKRLLQKCTHYFDGSKVVPLQEEDKQMLTRLILQWKASGLKALAFSFRPLTSQAETDIVNQLNRHNFFCATEEEDGSHKVVEVGRAGDDSRNLSSKLADSFSELQTEQVLLGMAAVKLCASVQMASYAEALQAAGIRFQVYSVEGEKRTRTLGAQLGLETGWNSIISLEKAVDVRNMMGQVILPSGITNIRQHIKEVDNVPLLVSLYARATPWRTQQMMSIMQEHAECVTCVGSALQPNFETFRQANISVSVLVGSVPQCRRCFGRREPRTGSNGAEHDLIFGSTVNQAEFQLSADLTSLPCALQARHSYSDGEQRTLGVLFNAIKEARRCVDCILMVLIHYICGAVQLAVIVSLEALICLPAPLEGFHVMCMLLVLLPSVSFSLIFNAASPQIMKELPLKKADEKTLAQPGRLMLLYAVRSVPSALVVVIAFVHDLHKMFTWQLEKGMQNELRLPYLAPHCEGLSWHWWLTGRWTLCVRTLQQESQRDGVKLLGVDQVHCAFAHAQQWGALLFVFYEVTLAFTFLDRYDSLITRGPASNKVLCGVAAFTMLAHTVISFLLIYFSCGRKWEPNLTPSWDQWLVYVFLWPPAAVLISEVSKRRDRKYHMHLQKTLRVIFNTRLGMWSPK